MRIQAFSRAIPPRPWQTFLIQHAPGNLDRVYFVSGGSEAVEAALKTRAAILP